MPDGSIHARRVLRLSRYGCHVWGMRLSRLGAWCGVIGPVLFTAAWVVSSLRQAGHSATEVQLSGLAADDARDPQIMMAGFVVLGAGTVAFGAGRAAAGGATVSCSAGLAGQYHLGVARPVPENALGRTVREQRPHFPGEVVKTITKQVRRRG